MMFSPNPMEFGALDDFEKFHEAEIYSKSNGICGCGYKMRFINFDKISPPSKIIKGLI
jgi:hypothetical protein